MNLIHRTKKGLFVFSVIFIFSSCGKELNQSPLDQFDAANFWTSEGNAMLALTGVYRGNTSVTAANANPTDWWSYAGLLFMEFATDNAYDRRGDNSVFNRLTNGTLTSNMAVLGQYWSQSYARVARCNDFLTNIDKVQMDETKKKRMKAEVRFLRACQYFYLSQYWGSVPLVKGLLTKEEANSLDKAPRADVVNFALTELTEAAADLPRLKDIPTAERGRASKQAALAFLGRLQLAEGKNAEAAISFKSIIDFGDNIIDPDYAGLFLISNENSRENIFSMEFVENLAANGMNQHLWPAVDAGWHIFCPLGSIVEAYDFTNGATFSFSSPLYDATDPTKNRDPRLKYNILFNGQSFKGKYITHPDSSLAPDQLGAGKQTTQTGYGIRKFCDPGFSGNLNNYGGNLPIIRYAEILLSYLEARLEAGQAIDQPLLDATINRVRSRASVGMPAITQTNPALLREILRKERRVETAFEGIRYWDLMRWKIADKVLKADFYGAPFPSTVKPIRKKGTTTDPFSRWFVTTKNFRVTDYFWPIPLEEVNINPKLK
ncbi:MAG: RagB/SusD family nutrient uptake outer membrane protein [Chitinophagaceae bacterium]